MKKIFALFTLLFCSIAQAHFTHFEPRIIHLYQDNQDTIALMRMPLPLVLLDNTWQGIDSNQDLPFTEKRAAPEGNDYFIKHDEVRTTLDRLKNYISQGYTFTKDGATQPFSVEQIHIFNTDSRKPFSDLDTALENFNGELVITPDATKLFDSGIDIQLRLPNTSIVENDITITSYLGDKFNAITRLANIITLHIDEQQISETTVGVLDYSSQHQPTLSHKLMGGFKDGFSHILIGLDHVLFVVLLFFSAPTFLRLLSLATAFTIGHSFSLFVGDSAPISSPLFTPCIELLIALTIGITAIALLFNKAQHLGTTPLLIIGVIHGFGFSFVFSELAQEGAQTSLINLLGFNLGIEAGQLFIYIVIFVLTSLLSKKLIFNKPLPYYVSLGTLAVSSYWIVTRAIPLVEYATA
ncbi:HupE/UreJ family protein [Neptuniibacter marinus]|uniref:HupE/UreJ family protein n=1 Tax=Neptuniibacter marinus TaxID=1806670 RepID=UPI00082AD94D|nr:HupE/UreJ family protein [Neptuniibacter marinus]